MATIPGERGSERHRAGRGDVLLTARCSVAASLLLLAAACGDGDATSASSSSGGAGGAGASSSTASSGSSTVATSSSSSSTTTGAGAGNPDDPYGCLQGAAPSRPASIPEGYRPYTCWSDKPQCMLWIPEDPETMVEPLEWEPCAEGAPGGDGCRQMKRPWWRGGNTAIGATYPALPQIDQMGDTTLLHVARADIVGQGSDDSWVEWDVYEVDGPALYAMRKHVPGKVECGYQDYDVTSGIWTIAPNGDDTVPIEQSPLDGLIVVDVAAKDISLPYRADDASTPGWSAGANGIIRFTSPALYLHDRDFTTETLLHSAGTDPAGISATTNFAVVGDAALWEVGGLSGHFGIRAYDPERGSHDLVRYLDDPTRGAATPGTDGVDLVWMEGRDWQPDLYTYAERDIMTSPFTTDPAALQPRRLRKNLATRMGTANDAFRVGCGRAAKSGGAAAKDIQIVRLADGQGWNLLYTQQLWHPNVIGMTCDEIFLVVQFWVDGEPQGPTIQRIRFDSLGEGLPPD